ncbi:hypothetical protein WA026_013245 [Henosepilachna vigintioctopunctata]|uniref:Uncharacterized protein n=1 Tax=Henosepilachna vigintioctopunctata TaxID=420089 RepID=A0AAW1UE21_9CUCU
MLSHKTDFLLSYLSSALFDYSKTTKKNLVRRYSSNIIYFYYKSHISSNIQLAMRRRRKCQDKSEYMKIGSILERAIFQSSTVPYRRHFLFGWRAFVWGIQPYISKCMKDRGPYRQECEEMDKGTKITNIRCGIERDQILV